VVSLAACALCACRAHEAAPAEAASAQASPSQGAVVRSTKERAQPTSPRSLPQAFEVQGRGTQALGEVRVERNRASVQVDGQTLLGEVYASQIWPEYGYTLLDVLVVQGGEYTVLYLYCDLAQRLTWAYWESFSQPMRSEALEGACRWTTQETPMRAQWGSVPPPSQGLAEGFVAKGDTFEINPQGLGALSLEGRRYEVWAFERVDCASCVGSGHSGWQELHAFVRDAERECFVVIYLYGPGDGEVASGQLGYGFCPVSGATLPDAGFEVRWWAPNAGKRAP
jgi:hypothetical protein